jgi:hypothetical protein
LGSCDQAAFAEDVYVWAKVTDGFTRPDSFDANSFGAFALTHGPA